MARICVVRQLYFPLDPRVRQEVEALVADGHQVDVISMRRPEEPAFEQNGNVTIRRVPLEHYRGGGLGRYFLEHTAFMLAAGLLLSVLHLRRRYHLIQVNSIPDTLVFVALVPRLMGARVLLDLQECMPEFFASKFNTSMRSIGPRIMGWLEQASVRFAHRVITPNDSMREAFISRGTPAEKVGVVMNSTDETLFDPGRFPPHQRADDRFTLICHGSIEERYGLDTVIRAVALLKDEIPGLHLKIFGEGSYLDELRALARRLAIDHRVYFSGGFVPIDTLLGAIASADAGVVAMKRDIFRDLTLCLKMFDYIAMRRPAIVSRTSSVERYFDGSCFQLFESDDPHDLARAIRELHADPSLGERLVRHVTEVQLPYRWPRQRERYQRIVASVLAKGKGQTAPAQQPELLPALADSDAPRLRTPRQPVGTP